MKKIFLTESQIRNLFETAKIRPLTAKDYKYKQTPKDELDFVSYRQSDDDLNKALGLTGNDKIDRLANLRQPKKAREKELSILKDKITNDMQQRELAKGNSIVQNVDNINIPEAAKKQLSANGIELEVKGKIFSYGNTKLPPSTMIINLTSAFNCPSTHCQFKGGECYAQGLEKQYVDYELRNLRNELTFDKLTVKEILQLLDAYIQAATVKIDTIRLSESGDFKSQEVVDFCEKLARHIQAKYGIRTVAYTHQQFDFTNCKAMIVNSSLPRQAIKGATRNYLAIPAENFAKLPEGLVYNEKLGTYIFKCHCDCYKCNFCYNTKEENGEDPNLRTNVYAEIREKGKKTTEKETTTPKKKATTTAKKKTTTSKEKTKKSK